MVVGALRQTCACDPAACIVALRRAGLPSEACELDRPDLWDWAAARLGSGRVLTAVCAAYPGRWIEALGSAAPPAVWLEGDPGALAGLAVSVVGVRRAEPSVLARAARLGEMLASSGRALCSGGAPGVDLAAEHAAAGAAGSVVEVLPCGLAWASGRFGLACPSGPVARVSPWHPRQPFGGDLAMRRNALVYALGERSIVVRARFREGGTWNGAVAALRRKSSRILVFDEGDPASRALIALGALGCRSEAEALGPLPEPLVLPLFNAIG
jgi:DNA processing protein